jgi:hypothetical protein
MMSAMFAAIAAGVAPSVAIAEGANRPARLEKVEGSEFPHVILLELAAKRLGILTTEVHMEDAKRWLVLIGEVEQASLAKAQSLAVTDSGAAVAGSGDAAGLQMWIRVPGDGEAAMDSQQRLLNIARGGDEDSDSDDYADASDPFDDADDGDGDDADDMKVVMVVPIGPVSAVKSYKARALEAAANMPADGRYFELVSLAGNAQDALKPGQRVFVRVAQPDSSKTAKIVPYSAVIYDVRGDSWLYANPEPLVFVRHKIVIERILGNVVVLSDGPPAGTRIVSVGAAELMGVEQKIGH